MATATVADAAPAAAAAAGAADAPMDGAAKPKRPTFIKANSTSTVFSQSSLTDPDVDELILRYTFAILLFIHFWIAVLKVELSIIPGVMDAFSSPAFFVLQHEHGPAIAHDPRRR